MTAVLENTKDSEFKKWVLKCYFSNKNSPWYSPDVNQENVLAYISKTKEFPCSMNGLNGLWIMRNSLASKQQTKTIKKEQKYTTGEVKLKDIGKAVGDVTATMVTKFYASAIGKIKFATGDQTLEQIDPAELEELDTKILLTQIEAAKEYAALLLKHNSNVEAFLQSLINNRYITKNELDLIEEEEIKKIALLTNYTFDDIVVILFKDIDQDNNIFKTYQSVVSKRFYKNKRFA